MNIGRRAVGEGCGIHAFDDDVHGDDDDDNYRGSLGEGACWILRFVLDAKAVGCQRVALETEAVDYNHMFTVILGRGPVEYWTLCVCVCDEGRGVPECCRGDGGC